MSTLRVVSYPYLVYLPQMVADHLGLYEAEGIRVQHSYHTKALGDVLHEIGDAPDVDLIVENIWLSLRSWNSPHRLVPISHLSQQAKWVIAGRKYQAEFTWQSLQQQSVIVPCESPTIWAAFRQVLHEAQVPLDDIRLVIGFNTVGHTIEQFTNGVGDYLITDIEIVQSRGLHEVIAIADSLGPIPWSVFSAPAKVVESRYDELVAFRRAIGQALKWIAETPASQIATRLKGKLDSLDRIAGIDDGTRLRIIDRYKSLGTGEWPSTPAFDRTNVARWQDALVRWGMQPQAAPLEEVLAFNDSISAAR